MVDQSLTEHVMGEGMKIALTALLAVATFVVGQFIQRLFVEPIQEQRHIIGRIAHALTFYRDIVKDAAGDKPSLKQIKVTKAALRRLASELRASLTVLPFYRFFVIIRCVLPAEKAKDVARQLMRWQLFMSEHAMKRINFSD